MQLSIVGILCLRIVSGIAVRSKDDTDYTLVQFADSFCKGKYHCLELTLDSMTQKKLPEGRSPPVLCDKLEKGEEEGSFVVHSCPGTRATGCPDSCEECHEDLVKHFEPDVCKDGYMLKKGKAEKDEGCLSVNKLDIGLARWCDKWPAPKKEEEGEDSSPARKARNTKI